MKLSIIVPVYNMAGGGKLTYCMESLLAQTLQDFEIIAVDDCSTDDSWRILREYERKHADKVRSFRHEVNKKQGEPGIPVWNMPPENGLVSSTVMTGLPPKCMRNC